MITINFTNATLTSSSCNIRVQGGAFELTTNEALTVSGTSAFNSLSITSGQVSLNVNSGSTFTGALTIPMKSADGGTVPGIEVSNFNGTVSVNYPSTGGPATQTLQPDNVTYLNNYISD